MGLLFVLYMVTQSVCVMAMWGAGKTAIPPLPLLPHIKQENDTTTRNNRHEEYNECKVYLENKGSKQLTVRLISFCINFSNKIEQTHSGPIIIKPGCIYNLHVYEKTHALHHTHQICITSESSKKTRTFPIRPHTKKKYSLAI